MSLPRGRYHHNRDANTAFPRQFARHTRQFAQCVYQGCLCSGRASSTLMGNVTTKWNSRILRFERRHEKAPEVDALRVPQPPKPTPIGIVEDQNQALKQPFFCGIGEFWGDSANVATNARSLVFPKEPSPTATASPFIFTMSL